VRLPTRSDRDPGRTSAKDFEMNINYDANKVDDLVLALLHLTSSSERGIVRAWKQHDWDALDRLHEQGLISDPKTKAKSVVLSDEGALRAKELFEKFCV